MKNEYEKNPIGFVAGIYKEMMLFIEEYPSMQRKKIEETKKKFLAEIKKIKNPTTKKDVSDYYNELMRKLGEQ